MPKVRTSSEDNAPISTVELSLDAAGLKDSKLASLVDKDRIFFPEVGDIFWLRVDSQHVLGAGDVVGSITQVNLWFSEPNLVAPVTVEQQQLELSDVLFVSGAPKFDITFAEPTSTQSDIQVVDKAISPFSLEAVTPKDFVPQLETILARRLGHASKMIKVRYSREEARAPRIHTYTVQYAPSIFRNRELPNLEAKFESGSVDENLILLSSQSPLLEGGELNSDAVSGLAQSLLGVDGVIPGSICIPQSGLKWSTVSDGEPVELRCKSEEARVDSFKPVLIAIPFEVIKPGRFEIGLGQRRKSSDDNMSEPVEVLINQFTGAGRLWF